MLKSGWSNNLSESKNKLSHELRGLVEKYRKSFEEHGDTPAGVQWPRGRQDIRFKALTQHFASNKFSVLDYGCGLGHLKDYLDKNFIGFEYLGADLVPEFISAVQKKYPEVRTKLLSSPTELIDPTDHVVASGTFNIIEGGDRDAYLEKVKQALLHLFSLARESLAVNFMTDKVDYMQPTALHVNMEEMINFVSRKMSARLLVNASYMPYEFTITVFKDDKIIRPNNVYRAS